MKSDIIYISVQPENESELYRACTRDFLLNGDPLEVGELVQSMMQSVEDADKDPYGVIHDEIMKDHAEV